MGRGEAATKRSELHHKRLPRKSIVTKRSVVSQGLPVQLVAIVVERDPGHQVQICGPQGSRVGNEMVLPASSQEVYPDWSSYHTNTHQEGRMAAKVATQGL